MPTLPGQRQREASSIERTSAALTRRINNTLDDAAAHARTALTDTLDKTPEGRPTAAKVRQSRSYQAALARLSELGTALQQGIEAFRVESYRAAWRFWLQFLHEDILRPNLTGEPSQLNLERCRTAMIHGRTLRQDIKFATDRIAKGLAPALTVAGNRYTGGQDAAIIVRRWSDGAKRTLQTRSRILLVDSQTMADRLAGRDVIKPEMLEPDPSLPE